MSTTSYSSNCITDDADAYRLYPQHRKWFNKLWFSEQMGYNCGPSGIAPHVSGTYIVRPIMNISGMSIGARKQYIEQGDYTIVEPGYFWCEWFDGPQYSVTYSRENDQWKQISCWEGEKQDNALYRFTKWTRRDHLMFEPLSILRQLSDVPKINVEFINSNPIEVHLRESPDPDYDEFIPIWEGEEDLVDKYQKMGYSYIHNADDGNGFLDTARIGFVVKNKKG